MMKRWVAGARPAPSSSSRTLGSPPSMWVSTYSWLALSSPSSQHRSAAA